MEYDSYPGDFHKLWHTHTPNSCHMEYGYSCMGYEIPAAMDMKTADPGREIYTFLGDYKIGYQGGLAKTNPLLYLNKEHS